MLNIIICLISTFIFQVATGCQSCCEEKRIKLLEISEFDRCEGEDQANYTFISQWNTDTDCSRTNQKYDYEDDTLISCSHDGQKHAYKLRTLARSVLPAGAYYQLEVLYLVVNGKKSLEGKYVYVKEYGLRQSYLKKCSSILGYSFVSSKNSILLISKKLDLTVFIDPIGSFETFKKGCNTECKGITYIV